MLGYNSWEHRMKALFIAHGFPRYEGDYMNSFLYDLAQGLRSNGVRVAVVAPHHEGLAREEEIGGIRVYRFRYAMERNETLAYRGTMHEQVLGSFCAKITFILFVFSFLFRTLRVIRRERPDILHVHWWMPGGIVGWIASILTRTPYVLTSHGTDLFIVRNFAILKPLARKIYGRARGIHVISSTLLDILEEFKLTDHERAHVFPMPVNVAGFTLQRVRTEVPNILFVGRLIERKGVEFLLRACRRLQDTDIRFETTVIGEGPERERLGSLARELGISEKIKFLDFVPHSEIGRYFSNASVLVLPSITDWKKEQEGLGMVVLEAMIARVPVVASDSGGIVDAVIHERTGLLVPERDVEGLAEAMKRILTDPAIARTLGDQGHEFAAEKFSQERTGEKTLRMYQNALGGDGGD
jgi:glycosyltransferase involved in cell wall biosynthesis